MNQGKLYIIASPIGNLEDITLRALRILKDDVDEIFCEDTRQTKKILNNFGIEKPLKSLHAHSKDSKIEYACNLLLNGKSLAYLSDCGTPGISDPGSRLVLSAREKNIKIIPLPGASALTSIVSVSGFSEKNVTFAGFLNKKEGKKRKELTALKEFNGIIVLYESPYRIKKLLNSINEVFPENRLLVAREMTKFYEQFYSGTAEEILADEINFKEKGEFAIAIHNPLIKKVHKKLDKYHTNDTLNKDE